MSSPANEQRFFVGIGTQRSGTTWLGHYFRAHPEVGFSPLKEIRFFDSKYDEIFKDVANSPLQIKLGQRGLLRQALTRPLAAPMLYWHWLGIRRHEDEHYVKFMQTVGQGRKIGGEISPSYAQLDDHAIGEIERLLNKPRYLYSLRNPADRVISEASFRRNNLRTDQDLSSDDPTVLVNRRLKESAHLDYASNAARYDKIVGPERFKIFFYEKLVHPEHQPAVLADITSFLGIAHKPGDAGKRVNASRKVNKDDVDRGAIVRALSAQYRFAEERFGDELPDNWKRDLEFL